MYNFVGVSIIIVDLYNVFAAHCSICVGKYCRKRIKLIHNQKFPRGANAPPPPERHPAGINITLKMLTN